VELLAAGVEAGELTVVGTPWRIRPGAETLIARAIALAVAHPFGIGDAQYRLAAASNEPPRAVDTVPFGVFRKSLWQRLGGFDERLLANEDYDFNYRVRAAGGAVLLDTAAHCDYFARPTVSALARQYFRYGRWKAQMIRRSPRSVRWRHLVAPAFVAALALSALPAAAAAANLLPLPAALPLALVVVPYALAAAACAAQVSLGARDLKLAPALVAIFFVLHAAWGAGFLLSLPRSSS
ncbi:MAG TPA: glycosyltransferase family 2 protein, partial [Pyrinomonadaceae bacterium]|nr:glycosyltransferase family 2 protein [Pyrinomonadaceae bacterium]